MAHRSKTVIGKSFRWSALLAASLVVIALSGASAQRPPAAQATLEQAEAALQEALASPGPRSPDEDAWRRTLTLARQALQQAPHDLEIERFLARAYSHVNWYIRAFSAWNAFLDDGGTLAVDGDPSDATMFAESGTQLGFARYQAGDLDGALPYYERVNAVLPDNTEALRWLGRIHFEQNDAKAALPFWQRLVQLLPDDQPARYFLDLTEQRLAIGAGASEAFQRGIAAHEAGDLRAALSAFQKALADNPDFVDGAVWAGRTSLELGEPRRAVDYWQQVVQARPNDDGAKYFLEVAKTQVKWGVDAGKAYYDGQAKYEKGDVEGARAAFERAVAANPNFVDAWVWAARTNQELGHAADAIVFWQGVLQRNPDDDRAKYFLDANKKRLDYGAEAGQAFIDGADKFQRGDFAGAEADLKHAVAANPSFTEAWGTLGRLYFQQERYAEAADAFDHALALRPGDDDYSFFASESRRLGAE